MTKVDLELSRRRRLVEAWRASAPSQHEIGALRARMKRAPLRPRRSRGKVIAVALVQGLFFGGAALATAAWLVGKSSPRPPAIGIATTAAPRAPLVPALSPAVLGVEVPATTAGVPTAAFDDLDGAPAAAERASSAPAGPRAPRGPVSRSHSIERPALATVDDPSPAVSATAADGSWARVARALSESDFSQADQALHELSASADPATRDAADLARAELSIAHGDDSASRPLVERLARSGATGLIRKRAAALLSRLPSP